MSRASFALRLLFLGFSFLTSLYGLLVFTPFTFTHVIQGGLVPWLSWFASAHRLLFVAAQAAAIVTLIDDLRAPGRRVAALVYALASVAAGVWLMFHPILSTLKSDHTSFVWSEIALLPALALAAIDHAAARGKIVWRWPSTHEDGSIFAASALCLVVVIATYSVIFHFRAVSGLELTRHDEAMALLRSVLLHSTFVGAAFIVWVLVRALASSRGQKAFVEYGLFIVLALGLFALLTRNIVFDAITFRGPLATVSALSWALVLVASVSGIALRKQSRSGAQVESGLRLFLSPLGPDRAPVAWKAIWLVFVLILAVRFQVIASRMDWNGLLQKLGACFTWVMVFAATLALFRPGPRGAGRTILFIGLASSGTVAYGAWRSFGHPADSAPVMEKMAVAEPSFGLLYDLAGAGGKRESMAELFKLMQDNTNMPKERRIEPLDLHFASDLGSSPMKKPHIFIIVVDSLRRDYVSPFNPAVTFTPSLEKFAKSSDVFANAFTHYGATGLSEPSIWVGGMMPHKQYITPFAPMNGLEKLLLAEHYTRMVSVDSILAQLLDQGSSLIPLDANTVTGDYDLCGSLDELKGKMDAHRNEDPRLFAYTQAQNIHVSRITREGAQSIDDSHYPGFYDPYASRLHRIDACFGRFIDYLEAQNLYDESIVVFTADHGDLLGEEGRWGHAYNLNPEVVRIPLIIHRPTRLRSQLSADPSAIAFSTDIAPSIYRMLGYMPATLGAGFGQSLYGPRSADREWHMLVSSYGPVYGILEDGGHHLYVADAVNYTDAYYDVAAGSNAPREPVPEDVRARNVSRIADGIRELHATFNVARSADQP